MYNNDAEVPICESETKINRPAKNPSLKKTGNRLQKKNPHSPEIGTGKI